MARKKMFKKKDKFDDLASEFKDAVQQSSTDEIRARISRVAILDMAEKALFKADPAVAKARAALKDLTDPYRDNIKEYGLQLQFMKKTLEDKGGGAAAEKPQPA